MLGAAFDGLLVFTIDGNFGCGNEPRPRWSAESSGLLPSETELLLIEDSVRLFTPCFCLGAAATLVSTRK